MNRYSIMQTAIVETPIRFDLADYLRGLNCKLVQSGILVFNGVNVECARYIEQGQQRIYCLGETPKAYQRRRATCFRIKNHANEYYVAAYMAGERIDDKFARFHPFGANFLLCEWNVPNGDSIDTHNYYRGKHKPYTRVPCAFIGD